MSDFQKDNDIQHKSVSDDIFTYTKDFFNKRQDKAGYFLTKKTERICAAIFLVTDFLPATDSFRTTLRSKGLLLIEGVYSTAPSPDESSNMLYALFSEVRALTEVGQIARMVSPMNASILIRECNALCEYLEEGKNSSVSNSHTTLHTTLFEVDVSKEIHTSLPTSEYYREEYKRHIKDSSPHYSRDEASGVRAEANKRQVPTQTSRAGLKGHTKDENRENQRDRRARILSVLQKKDHISVKDVAQAITDCSEKTLQRELLGLVAQGVLKKEGERRWSTYTLAA